MLFEQVSEEHFKREFRIKAQQAYGDAWLDLTLREANDVMEKAGELGSAAFKEFNGEVQPAVDVAVLTQPVKDAFDEVFAEMATKAANMAAAGGKVSK